MKKLFFFAFFSLLLYGCPDALVRENCSLPYYDFDISVSFQPSGKTIHIGDTVSISSVFPDILCDQTNTDCFTIEDSINLFIGNYFIKLDTLIENHITYNFTKDFEFLVDSIYNFRIGNYAIGLDYYRRGNEYDIQYIFIPKKKGIYLFEFSSRINVSESYRYQILESISSECRTNRWAPVIITNNGLNNNKELLKESPTEFYNTKSYDEWDLHNTVYGAHCFIVE